MSNFSYIVELSYSASEVNHGLNGGATLEGLVAAVHLGVGLLHEGRPELVLRLRKRITICIDSKVGKL